MKSEQTKHPLWQVWNWKLHWQILLGLLIGGATGVLLAKYAMSNCGSMTADEFLKSHPLRLIFKTGGEMFLNSLKLIVIPLVTSSILLSISSIAAKHGFGRLGIKTLTYYLATSTIAILIGLALVNWVKPGVVGGEPLLTKDRISALNDEFQSEQNKLASSAKLDQEKSGATLLEKVLNVIKTLIPSNPIKAAAEMDLLGLIVISILVGYFVSRLTGPVFDTMNQFWQGIYEISMMLTDLILRFAPLGVGMLLASTISENWVQLATESRVTDLIDALKWFAITTVVALSIHLFVVLPLILFMFTGLNPIKHFKAMMPSLLTAFSTASSNATISVTLDCCENRAGVSKETASFVVPLGATVNMNGTALYECVASMFIVQLFGFSLDFSEQFMVVLIALLTSVGVAGVPSASLVAILVILNSVSKQIGQDLSGGLAILLILDRPLDMLRTAVNVFGDATGAVLIAKTEGESPLSEPLN